MSQSDADNPFNQDTPGNIPGDSHPDSTDIAGDVDLTSFDDEFESAQAADLEEVPDGKYQVRVFKVSMAKSQKNDPMIKWDLVVISGQLAGRHIFKNSVITAAALPFVKGDLKTLGLQLVKFSDLPNHLVDLLDLAIEVTKRTKGEYSNVYFNKHLNIPLSADLAPNPAPGPAPGNHTSF